MVGIVLRILFTEQQYRHERRPQGEAGLDVEGVFHQHGEEHHGDEGEIDEGNPFFHRSERINQQET